MSPVTCALLLQAQQIILAVLQRNKVKRVGSEDLDELAADGTAQAARMLDAAERNGKQVSANSVAYFVLSSMQIGRRFNYAGNMDVMCPSAELAGTVTVSSMDENMGVDEESGDDCTLHDILASRGEDVDCAAARELDWDTALQTMDDRMRAVVQGTAEGIGTGELAVRYSISAPRVCQVREEAGDKILETWGGDPIQDATREPVWGRHVRSYAERRTCRMERAAEWKAR